MDQQGFVRLSLVTFVLVFVSFLVLGFSRLVLPFGTAQRLAAPIGVLGFCLLVYLFVRALLDRVGVWRIADADR